MSDIIKQIDDALDVLKSTDFNSSEHIPYLETWEAALTVLQKIASGDDWFDIETAPDGFISGIEDDGDMQVCWRKDRCFLRSGDLYDYAFNPKKWKHIDGEKHIKMMMERELNK